MKTNGDSAESAQILEYMLRMQERLQKESFGCDPRSMELKDRVDYVRWNVLALTDELHEALAETSWKPWTNKDFINEEELKSELVDAWHFMMNLFLASGMSTNELFYRYTEKHAVNAGRMKSGEYDGVKDKCPTCRRELDKAGALTYWGEGGSPASPPATFSCKGCGATVPPGALTSTTRNRAATGGESIRNKSGECDGCGRKLTGANGKLQDGIIRRNQQKVQCTCGFLQFFKQRMKVTVEGKTRGHGHIYSARGASVNDISRYLEKNGFDPYDFDVAGAKREPVVGT